MPKPSDVSLERRTCPNSDLGIEMLTSAKPVDELTCWKSIETFRNNSVVTVRIEGTEGTIEDALCSMHYFTRTTRTN